MRLVLLFILLSLVSVTEASPRHCRDCSRLSQVEQDFAAKLSVSKRKIFCGKFSDAQRRAAMRRASQSSPDEAIVKVMEETGMPLAVKSRKEAEQQN